MGCDARRGPNTPATFLDGSKATTGLGATPGPPKPPRWRIFNGITKPHLPKTPSDNRAALLTQKHLREGRVEGGRP